MYICSIKLKLPKKSDWSLRKRVCLVNDWCLLSCLQHNCTVLLLNIHMCMSLENRKTTSVWASVPYRLLDQMLQSSITGLNSSLQHLNVLMLLGWMHISWIVYLNLAIFWQNWCWLYSKSCNGSLLGSAVAGSQTRDRLIANPLP